jgi:SAM-dependent methyltransferase/uncharacterized protein YbaR (Trm112 family)
MPALDPWLAEHLACPRDRGRLHEIAGGLACGHGHSYPIVDGVPVMLVDESTPTIDIAPASLRAARVDDPTGLYLETLSLSPDEKQGIVERSRAGGPIDAVVMYLVAATNGLMYRHLIGQLQEYPIPTLSLPPGNKTRLLDVGCSWGRWTLAAGRAGYQAVGIDPSLGAVMAARRVARQTGSRALYVVADARYLPFVDNAFDTVYSYSVIQHFSRADATLAIGEAGRVLHDGGCATIQMPTRYGVRCLYHQARRGFTDGAGFDVRYWSLPELRRLFTRAVGKTRFDVDCYFGIGLQRSDAALMPPSLRAILALSESLKAVSRVVAPLVWVADSVVVTSLKAGSARA